MKIIIFALALFSQVSFAAYTLGGYSEYSFNTQSDLTGAKNIFSFIPQIGYNSIIPMNLPLIGSSLFFPEFGFILHTNTGSTYSKTQLYFLLDFGISIGAMTIFKYGMGTFISKVSGTGGNILLQNGNSSVAFPMPSKSKTSINTTLDLGLEHSFDSNNAIKLTGYVFSLASKVKRSFSYTLAWVYFPN